MSPAELNRFLGGLTREQAIEESSGESVPAADAIEHVQFALRSNVRLAVDPGNRAPAVAACGVHFPQRLGSDIDLRMPLQHPVHHAAESPSVQRGASGRV